ncbi:unnamed protein product [Nyctereutes procyonoides]|uniref:(raccoon dog) hypothetical protein n=1 Tax=Nyctereutes procyonoides TaxID=34880 RepID=A0A811Y0G5_NYCPR|nr:unnamed protein product [Nyctereutes procyonoides]
MAPMKKLMVKRGKKINKKKQALKFTLDCTAWTKKKKKKIKVNKKVGNLGGGVVTTERSKSKILVISEVTFDFFQKVVKTSHQKIFEE